VAGTDLVGRTRCREDRILTCLDAGITALELTEVERVDEIDDVVRWASFPPDGSRGIGRARANHYGHVDGGYRRFVESARRDGIDLIVHIETVQAVHEIKEIAAHPWVTALVVGAHDLAASAGHPGDPGNPVVRELIDRAIAAIRASEVGLGLSASSAADARAARDRGADLLLISQARLLSGALASVTDAVRQEQS
jgi:4-hydroxy-2-oxoheptanedioate aldolase